MLPKESHALVFHEGHSTAAVHVQFQLTISFLNCMFVVARLCFAQGLLHVMYPYLRFVPPYSPDLNPIELAFSKVKAFLKTNDKIFEATHAPRVLVASAFSTITQEDCAGYIHHWGYK